MASVVTPEPELMTPAQEVMNLEREYLLQNYARYPLALHRGKGCYVYDLEGNRYLDLISGIGVNSLGYAHPRITKDHPPASRLAAAHVEPLLPRISRPFSRAFGQNQRFKPQLFL